MGIPQQRVNKLISDHGLRFLIKEDYRVHQRDWTRPGFRALASYRLAAWARGLSNPLARLCFMLLGRTLLRFVRNQYGIELSSESQFGRRLRIGHQNGIVIHQFAIIGDDCLVRQGVTLGIGGLDRIKTGEDFRDSGPVLGNRVDIGAGAMIVGKVRIGDDVKIGPNAVVVTDVSAGSTVMAPMSKIMRRPSES